MGSFEYAIELPIDGVPFEDPGNGGIALALLLGRTLEVGLAMEVERQQFGALTVAIGIHLLQLNIIITHSRYVQLHFIK